MDWLLNAGAWIGKAIISVFAWAYESPTLGVVVGAALTIYGIAVDDPTIAWSGVFILAAGILGYLVPTATDVVLGIARAFEPAQLWSTPDFSGATEAWSWLDYALDWLGF